MTVAVAIPSIPPRTEMLQRALLSVLAQQRKPDEISVAIDHNREGAAATRNRAWRNTTSEFVAFLDDDDELGPMHLWALERVALEEGADFVFAWFDVVGGVDPFPMHFGKEWDPANPHQTTITGLWRREALEAIGGFPPIGDGLFDAHGDRIGEDYKAVLNLNEKGGRIVHLPERTWSYHHHMQNTSGIPARW